MIDRNPEDAPHRSHPTARDVDRSAARAGLFLAWKIAPHRLERVAQQCDHGTGTLQAGSTAAYGGLPQVAAPSRT